MLKLVFRSFAYQGIAASRGVAFLGIALLGAACSGPTSDSVARGSGSNSIVNNVSKFSVASYGVAASPRLTSSSNVRKGGGRSMVGSPYKVAGNWYYPAENTSYDETGTASWYGPNFHGRLTANGEIFDQFHLSGAHPTLPLPSYVRVQNLTNGRSTVVRINDRGPFAHNRLIDVSRRTAEVLGFIESGTAQVRVTYLGPAPVEGDDTNYLIASIEAPRDVIDSAVRAGARNQPSIISREAGGLLGAFASLFSYSGASQGEKIISDAHAAAMAVGTTNIALQEWQNSIEGSGTDVRLDLGIFENSVVTNEIARKFALLASVEILQESGASGSEIRLVLTYLKPGVKLEDINSLRNALGV